MACSEEFLPLRFKRPFYFKLVFFLLVVNLPTPISVYQLSSFLIFFFRKDFFSRQGYEHFG